jgi:plastocyanin
MMFDQGDMFMKIQVLAVFAALSFANHAGAQEAVLYSGCTEADFETIDAATVEIGFQGTSYTPQCIKVKAGTVVTIAATAKHPLQAAANFDGVENPFTTTAENFVADQTRTLTKAGSYGYYCTHHGRASDGKGMGGLIIVLP